MDPSVPKKDESFTFYNLFNGTIIAGSATTVASEVFVSYALCLPLVYQTTKPVLDLAFTHALSLSFMPMWEVSGPPCFPTTRPNLSITKIRTWAQLMKGAYGTPAVLLAQWSSKPPRSGSMPCSM